MACLRGNASPGRVALLADRGPALLGDRPGMVQRRGEVLEGDAGGALDVDRAGDRAGQRRGVAQLAGDVAQVVDRRPLPVGVVAPALLGPSRARRGRRAGGAAAELFTTSMFGAGGSSGTWSLGGGRPEGIGRFIRPVAPAGGACAAK